MRVELSRFEGIFDIVSTEIRFILSIFVATDVNALFTKPGNKISYQVFKTRGVNCFLNNVKKNGRNGIVGYP